MTPSVPPSSTSDALGEKMESFIMTTISWFIRQVRKPCRWAAGFARYHFGRGQKVAIGFSGDVPAALKGQTVKGRMHKSIFTARSSIHMNPTSGTIIHIIDDKKKS
jgi:hypothetical protein